MSIESDLYSGLTGHAGLSALISTRLYPDVAPQNATRPYVVYQRISTRKFQAISGTVVAYLPRFQFSIYADTALSALNVAAQVQVALLAMSDSSVTIYERPLENERTTYEDQSHLFRRDFDAQILHS